MLSRSGVVPFALIIFESGQSAIYSTENSQWNPVLAAPTAVMGAQPSGRHSTIYIATLEILSAVGAQNVVE
jgi:hypothetical protein